MKKYLLFFYSILFVTQLNAQNYFVKGQVIDADAQTSLIGVKVSVKDSPTHTFTDGAGFFQLEVAAQNSAILTFELDGYELFERSLTLGNAKTIDLGNVLFQSTSGGSSVPTITLNSGEIAGENDFQDISGLLTASSDIFASTVRFPFFAARFNIKGYNSDHTAFHLNGIPMNSLENGWVYWEAWSGLNDVTRNQYSNVGLGLSPMPFSFGGLGGAANIDVSASSQRKQTRVSFSIANRSYTNRLMVTHSTGELKNGWAFSFSGSRRWAQEGYLPGSFYDAWGYFVGVDKKNI